MELRSDPLVYSLRPHILYISRKFRTFVDPLFRDNAAARVSSRLKHSLSRQLEDKFQMLQTNATTARVVRQAEPGKEKAVAVNNQPSLSPNVRLTRTRTQRAQVGVSSI